jgi:hypothetical protein
MGKPDIRGFCVGPKGDIYWRAVLVFVWLADDRRFLGAVLFFVLVVFVLVLFIRISGGIMLSMIVKALQSILVEASAAMCGVMLLLLKCDSQRFLSLYLAKGDHRDPGHPEHTRGPGR